MSLGTAPRVMASFLGSGVDGMLRLLTSLLACGVVVSHCLLCSQWILEQPRRC